MIGWLCVLIGHRWGLQAARGSHYDRCPRCGKCRLRPIWGVDFPNRATPTDTAQSEAERHRSQAMSHHCDEYCQHGIAATLSTTGAKP